MTKPPPQPTTEEWEKEFDEKFTYTDENGDQYLLGGFDPVENRNTDCIPEIKSFISAQLQQAVQEERERCLGCVDLVGTSIMNPDYGYIEYVKDQIRTKIKEVDQKLYD